MKIEVFQTLNLTEYVSNFLMVHPLILKFSLINEN